MTKEDDALISAANLHSLPTTTATVMDLLSKAIKNKLRFVEFMNKCYRKSGTSLSLQALLLKPIQQFHQFNSEFPTQKSCFDSYSAALILYTKPI